VALQAAFEIGVKGVLAGTVELEQAGGDSFGLTG
jgi:hypothetical protein